MAKPIIMAIEVLIFFQSVNLFSEKKAKRYIRLEVRIGATYVALSENAGKGGTAWHGLLVRHYTLRVQLQ